jgi:Tfp pilus assembly protein PilE
VSMRRNGLTLIEVLIIVVIGAILVTLVIQKIGGKKMKEVNSALLTDVRNARTAESKYFGVHNMYGTFAQLDSAHLFSPIPGDTVTIALTPTGYTATALHGQDPVRCTLAVTGGESGAAAPQVGCQ